MIYHSAHILTRFVDFLVKH